MTKLTNVRTWTAATMLVAAVTSTSGAQTRSQGTPAPDPDRKDWIELFNGKDLTGWIAKIAKHDVGDNYANTFSVKDGIITARYDGYGGNYNAQFGHLYYEKPFSYYLVSLDYRLVGDSTYPGAPSYTLRNSGLMVSSQDPRTMPRDQNFPISIEMQFYGGLGNGRPRPTGNMCSPGTAIDYEGKFDNRHCINSTSPTFEGDQWVHAEALVLGDSITKFIVNGDTVFTFTHTVQMPGVVAGYDPAQLVEKRPITSGYIALQAEGHPVDFRNIRLLNLEGCTDPRSKAFKRYYIKSNPEACK